MYKVDINIIVKEEYNNGTAGTVNKSIRIESFEEVARIVGSIVSHIPKGKS